MKSQVKKALRLPFRLLEKIDFRGESFLSWCAAAVLGEDAKLRLARQTLIELVGKQTPEKRFKIGSYLNALGNGSVLAERFATRLIDNLSLYESQLGQECIVDTVLDGKEDGVFVEIGVGDGRTISNTYFLEKYRNWTGVLCDPSIKFHDSIRRQRDATLITDAVYDRTGLELQFSEIVGNEELSTLSDQTITDSHDRSAARKYPVNTISFNDLYRQYLNGSTIDYLSLDTEGSELTILNGIDFDAIDISVISVEHSYDGHKLEKIRAHLGRFGYVEILAGVFEFDAVFVKQEICERLK
jgi:FkbM family methyltransferase